MLLALPIYCYVVAAWFIRPLSANNIALAYAVPLSFVTGLLLIDVPRSELLATLRRVRVELSLALVMSLMPSAMVPASVAADAATCKTLEDDIEVELSGVLEGVSMYDLLSHYLENPPTLQAGAAARVRQFGGC